MVITYMDRRLARRRRSDRRRWFKASLQAIPLCTLVASLVLMAVFGRRLLVLAVTEPIEEAQLLPFFVSVAALLASVLALVLVRTARIAERAVSPERKLMQAMRRVRSGDVGFRVHLRSGDLLVNLAEEFNALLDWLNVNPPEGVITGSDVVDVEEVDQVHSMELDPEDTIHLDVRGEAIES